MVILKWSSKVLLAVIFFSTYFSAFSAKTIRRDLRRGRNVGFGGRFLVERAALEKVLQDLRLEEDIVQLLDYGHDGFGEVIVSLQTVQDIGICQAEISLPEHRRLPATEAKYAVIGVVVVAKDGTRALISIARFTDAVGQLAIPYMTNVETVRRIDSIEMGGGHVILRHCDDVMNITINYDESCDDDGTIAEDFAKLTGGDIHITDYPAPFDWGCEILGDDVSFCRDLQPLMGDILGTNGDVCTTMSTTKSTQCRADMAITSMTGMFRSTLPFLAESVPIQSLEAEWLDREHGIGIVYPCF